MKKETKILILLFVVAFLIRAVFVFVTPLKIWDETVYANLGYDLSNNFLDYSVANNGWSDFIPSGGDNFYAWPKMGFRAPLLPYLLSVFYFVGADFFVSFFMVFVGALSVCFIYLLGKEIFNEQVAWCSAILFAFVPLHVFYSAKILTGILFTFFVILSFLSFWKGYEKGNKKHKILFGVFLALALLSRYTALWIIPIFFFYFLIRDKSFNFLRDKYLWYSILGFFIILIPWFIYGFFVYGNPIGAFIHGGKAAAYWGGLQSWDFFFSHWWQMFSIIGFVFLVALAYILYKRGFLKKEIYFLLIWFVFFLGMAIYMPHKEERFIMAIIPAIVLIVGYFLNNLKRCKRYILIGIILVCLLSLNLQFFKVYNQSYTDTNICFLKGNEFLRTVNGNSVVITDESSVVYYYTKLETRFYPNPWDYQVLRNWVNDSYSGREVYVLFGSYILGPEEKILQIKKDLKTNLDKVFECSFDEGRSVIYKFG